MLTEETYKRGTHRVPFQLEAGWGKAGCMLGGSLWKVLCDLNACFSIDISRKLDFRKYQLRKLGFCKNQTSEHRIFVNPSFRKLGSSNIQVPKAWISKNKPPGAWIFEHPSLRRFGFSKDPSFRRLDFSKIQAPGGLFFSNIQAVGNLGSEHRSLRKIGSWSLILSG